VGLDAAKEADDRALGAYLVGSSCVQPAYRERPFARLRRLEGRTFGFARTDASPSTRAWLATLEAEAHALAGDTSKCLRAFDEAEAAMSGAGGEDESRRPRVAFFDRNYLAGERGVALARLGQPDAAQEALRPALASLDPTAVKTRPRLLTALATAHVQQRDVDRACELGAEALRMPHSRRYNRTSKTCESSGLTLNLGGTARRSRTWTSSSEPSVPLSDA
jgi:tetratricopeptide (TPR) repeat protein